MKKTIITLSTIVLTSVSAFAQIPNSGFENWTTVGNYSVPNNWGTMNNTTTLAGVYTAEMGTPGNPGASYLKLTSKSIMGLGVVNGIAVSGVLDSLTMTPKSGFAFSQRPLNMTGKWQHMIYGNSQGSVSVKLTRWDNGLNTRVTVATGSVTLSGMAMSWANFSIPLSYTDGNNPDTCIIVLKASGSNPTDMDYLWVDNLAFSGTVTAIQNQTSVLSQVSVFPNPTAEILNFKFNLTTEQLVSAELFDETGKLMVSKDFGKLQGESQQILNINNIAKGIYFIKVTTPSGISEIKKIVIE